MAFSQPIFAMRVIGTHVTFYRVDFPTTYIESFMNGEPPSERITIFRIGGDRAKEHKKLGLRISDHHEQRVKVLAILCNILSVCSTEIYPYWLKKKHRRWRLLLRNGWQSCKAPRICEL
eukprot:Phypoly_transcript_21500.p1 GENE.Phypoly_transcript_21500~~Phypoly_transcript_21500.p1  ORF type:complete len:119 (+),score=6.03 Phypoly_transcript_21500:164-520(+)